MEITKDLFMKLANKFFADPSKGRVFREYCEDVGILMDMTVEEMKTKIRSYHKQKIAWSDTIINTLKDVRLPEIEEAIKTLEEKGFDAIQKYGSQTMKTFNWTGKEKTYKVEKARLIKSLGFCTTKEHCPNKTCILIENWDDLSNQMKKEFWKMQRTLLRYDRYMSRKRLAKHRKQIAYSKRVIQKLDRLSEEEVRIYYRDVVKDELEKK